MNKKALLLLFVVMVAVCSFTAIAADPISKVLQPFKDFNLSEIYSDFGWFIDFVIYSVIFVTVCMFALQNVFTQNNQPNPTVGVVLGIAFGIAATVFARKVGFRLTDIGFIVLLLFFFIVAFAIYRLIMAMLGVNPQNDAGRAALAAAWALVIAWAVFKPLIDTVIANA